MYKLYYILIAVFCLGCTNSNNIEFTVSKNKIIFPNLDKKLDNNSIRIYVWNVEENTPNAIPVSGQFKFTENDVSEFIPNFPLVENTQYVLIQNTKKGKIQQCFSLSDKIKNTPQIEAIYPTSDSLPENLLRMYIVFSQPMKTTGNIENIKLINNKGKEIKGAIFNNVYELWDESQKQLTVILDPSRIKTDLKANKELGRALEVGKKFQVVVTKAEDINGQQLQKPFIKSFQVISKDTISPNTKNWKLSIPKYDSKYSLQLLFKTPLDKMSLYNRIKVIDELEQEMEGKVLVSNQEKLWQFIPNKPWKKGNYNLLINSRLEDPSGNNLNGLFDHKIDGLKDEQEGKILVLPFKI